MREGTIRRLSKSVEALRPHYDAIVVGSGYGGGVAASRLSRCGFDVCVLERGREIQIGEFPDRLSEAKKEFQISSADKHIGNRSALFDLRLGEDINVLQGCGLGGTSLINANVCLKPDPRVFEDPIWPDEIRSDHLLEEGFARARRMLRPVHYGADPELHKTNALGLAAKALGQELKYPPVHVTFSEQTNTANIRQPACTLCGDCCAGCNVGAKSTVQLTYLADAQAYGCEIFTGVTVLSVNRKADGNWDVRIETRSTTNGRANRTLESITANIVVLAAGTLGSAEILLRSQEDGLPLSDQLGKRFTANGDALAIGYNNDVAVNGTGVGYPAKADLDPVGPAVVGLIDLRNSDDVNDGIGIVEASMPSAIAVMLPSLLSSGSSGLIGKDTDFSLRDELDEYGRALKSLIRGAYTGAIYNTQTYLAVGHDDASGEITLENDRIVISWPQAAKQKVYERIDQLLTKAVAATGGTYIKNPMSQTLLGERLLTVHPLGGCALAKDRDQGVVNHKCQVFNGIQGAPADGVHKGLYVCDGSVLPRSVGIHPLFTITAVSERAMMHLAADYGKQFNDAPNPKAPHETIDSVENPLNQPSAFKRFIHYLNE